MTTIESSPESAAGTSGFGRLLAADVDWLTSTDHKKIGRLFIGGGLLGLLATIVVNLLIGVERLDGGDVALDADAWVQLFSAQRFGLVFGTALPLAMGLCVAVAPLQLGARSIAFPRLAQSGFFMWFGGFVLAIVAVASNGGFAAFNRNGTINVIIDVNGYYQPSDDVGAPGPQGPTARINLRGRPLKCLQRTLRTATMCVQ